MHSASFRAVTTRVIAAGLLVLFSSCLGRTQPYYVSPVGNDANPGTLAQPFATLPRAQQAVRQQPGNVFLRGGTYYLSAPMVFTAQDSGTQDAPVVFQNYRGEQPVISGGVRLAHLDWQPWTNGIYAAHVPEDLQSGEIFVNGERQVLARYPNFDPQAKYFDGFTSGPDIQQRASRWADPAGGFLHAMHPALWGDFTWRISGKNASGVLSIEGGWQNNRGGGINERIQFVENIFEELDAPGEWFLNSKYAVFLSAGRTGFEKCRGGSHPPANTGGIPRE